MQRRSIYEVSVEGAQRRKPSNRIVRTQHTCAFRNFVVNSEWQWFFYWHPASRRFFFLFKVYSIKVAWSDGTTNIVYRRFSEVLQLEVKTTWNVVNFFYVLNFPCFYCSYDWYWLLTRRICSKWDPGSSHVHTVLLNQFSSIDAFNNLLLFTFMR